MNWAGTGLASLLAALLGALAGAATQYAVRRHFGIDFPPIVGILAGLAAASVSREKSGMRGIIVASIAVWAAAIAEVGAAPAHGMIADLLHFNERFGPLRFTLYLVCLGAALVLASRSLRFRFRFRVRPRDST